MEKSDYVYKPEDKYLLGQTDNKNIDVEREKGIIKAMKDVENRDIQIGILKIGRIEKSSK